MTDSWKDIERNGDRRHPTENELTELLEKVDEHVRKRRALSWKEVAGIVAAIATAVVALGTAATWAINAWTSWGWVTHGEFTTQTKLDGDTFLTRQKYEADTIVRNAHNLLQDQQIEAEHKTGNEILAFVKVMPQLKVLIKVRCMGNRDVTPMIDSLKVQFHDLTGRDPDLPACDDPEIKGR